MKVKVTVGTSDGPHTLMVADAGPAWVRAIQTRRQTAPCELLTLCGPVDGGDEPQMWLVPAGAIQGTEVYGP